MSVVRNVLSKYGLDEDHAILKWLYLEIEWSSSGYISAAYFW